MPERTTAAPVVSVLVPVYNTERYLAECLDSLVAQTFGSFEAILINDGSTDGSRDVIARYLRADARLSVIDKPNSGYGASMNRGLDASRGTYVAILESDDLLEPQALELLVAAARRARADVAKANFWLYWSAPRERCDPFDVVLPPMAGRTAHPSTDPDKTIFFQKPSIWSAVYRRDFLEREGIRFLETPGASYQDTSFNFKVWALAGRATYLAERVLRYRQDNEASSINSAGKLYCVCDEYAEIRRFLDGRDDLAELLDGVVSRMKFDAYMWNAKRLAPELRAQFLSRAREELLLDRAAGRIDESLLGIYKRFDLEGLLDRPERFARAFGSYGGGGVARSLRHYLALGGPALLARMLLAWCGR